MYVLIIVLNAVDEMEDILSGFLDEGISGATILDSQGMGRAIVDGGHNSIPLFGALHSLLADSHPYSKTIFTVLENEVMVDKAVEVVQEVITELGNSDTGFMFTVPIGAIYPMTK